MTCKSITPYHIAVVLAVLFAEWAGAASALYVSEFFVTLKNDTVRLSDYANRLPLCLGCDTIINREALASVAKKLQEVRAGKRTAVSIVHIGDSHIQAGSVTAPVRKALQEIYGNAGRGLVFPYRLVKSNGPADYSFSGQEAWKGFRAAGRDTVGDSLHTGISGFVAWTDENGASVSVRVRNSSDRFDSVAVFASNTPTVPLCADGVPMTGSRLPWHHTRVLDSLSESLVIQQCRDNAQSGGFALEGIDLRNRQRGVVYHSIGVNGAEVIHFLSSSFFWEQLTVLEPDLVIVSLGVNDAYKKEFDTLLFRQNLDTLQRRIRASTPGVEILFTTVTDHDFRQSVAHSRKVRLKNGKSIRKRTRKMIYEPNPHASACNTIIRQAALSGGCAVWDAFTVMGGESSIALWEKAGCAAPDHVHLTGNGYLVLGLLLGKAMLALFGNISR